MKKEKEREREREREREMESQMVTASAIEGGREIEREREREREHAYDKETTLISGLDGPGAVHTFQSQRLISQARPGYFLRERHPGIPHPSENAYPLGPP